MGVIQTSFDKAHLKEVFAKLPAPHIQQMDFIEA